MTKVSHLNLFLEPYKSTKSGKCLIGLSLSKWAMLTTNDEQSKSYHLLKHNNVKLGYLLWC